MVELKARWQSCMHAYPTWLRNFVVFFLFSGCAWRRWLSRFLRDGTDPSDATDTRNWRWLAPSASSSTAALQRCAHGHAVLAGLPARVCRRRERLGWRQSLVLGAFESSRCVHHSHGHREGACKPKIFRKLATNEGSRELVGGDSIWRIIRDTRIFRLYAV